MKPLVRIITTAEGKFLNSDDLCLLIQDKDFLAECTSMMIISIEKERGIVGGILSAIAYAIVVAGGDLERLPTDAVKWKVRI